MRADGDWLAVEVQIVSGLINSQGLAVEIQRVTHVVDSIGPHVGHGWRTNPGPGLLPSGTRFTWSSLCPLVKSAPARAWIQWLSIFVDKCNPVCVATTIDLAIKRSFGEVSPATTAS